MKRIKYILNFLLLASLILPSCRKIEKVLPPIIRLEQANYQTKPDRLIKITPTFENIEEDAVYAWREEGKILGTEPTLVFSSNELGTHHLTLTVTTPSGSAKANAKVEVVEFQLPIISIEGGGEPIVEIGEKYELTPIIDNKEGLKLTWIRDNQVVSENMTYTFTETKPGVSFVTLKAVNEDGEDEYLIRLTVVNEIPVEVSFDSDIRAATVGRTIRIPANVPSSKNMTFEWYVDGKKVEGEQGSILTYEATKTGNHQVKVIGKKGDKKGESTLTLQVVEPNQYYRPFVEGTSKRDVVKVFEFLPAPGQFVNERYVANTMEEACQYAQSRLAQHAHISLGGFGGYIIVGFDHSVKNTGDYDFAIEGNSFKGSSEPGIVWVMQDENGDGLPNDTWYELKGSETGKPETIQDYEITYYRPLAKKANTMWTDNRGNRGEVDWLGFHQQDFYYPNWVKNDTYMLRGTCLASQTFDQSGQGTYWVNPEFDWGYADNFSPIDRLTNDINYNAAPNANHFKISHAIDHKLQPVQLDYIDFVKVQTGLNTKAGWLGENSTEVFKFIDIYKEKK